MSPDLTMAGYSTLLVRFAALHQTLDREIAAQLHGAPEHVRAELDIASRTRLPLLALDLDRLGIALPAPEPFPLTSVAGALGALYVTEGATLGGRVIAPHVRAVLGPATPVNHFAPPGVDVIARWTSCRRVIDRLLVTPAEQDEGAAVAVALFDRFAEVLTL
jgi:heme oxygenase